MRPVGAYVTRVCLYVLGTNMNCAKTDELIKVPFEMHARVTVGPRNHVPVSQQLTGETPSWVILVFSLRHVHLTTTNSVHE